MTRAKSPSSVFFRTQICKSDLKLCPPCYKGKKCIFRKLSNLCTAAKWHDIFDSPLTIVFAIFMQIWATYFHIYWKRNEYKFKLRWGVINEEIDTEYRLEYKENVKLRKLSPISGELEPYMSNYQKILSTVLSSIATILSVNCESIC